MRIQNTITLEIKGSKCTRSNVSFPDMYCCVCPYQTTNVNIVCMYCLKCIFMFQNVSALVRHSIINVSFHFQSKPKATHVERCSQHSTLFIFCIQERLQHISGFLSCCN